MTFLTLCYTLGEVKEIAMGKTFKDNHKGEVLGSLGLARRLEKAKQCKRDFRCCNCGDLIPGNALGSGHRNHCPYCLFSKHVDGRVGDRTGSSCNGKMKPDAIRVSENGDIQILHVCTRCRKHSWNRISGDDDFSRLLKLSEGDEELIALITEGYFGKAYLEGNLLL